MSFAFVGITLNIRNNKTYPIRINVLGSPFNPLDTANAKTEYRWDITAFIPSNDDTLTLQYKPVGAAVFSTFTYQIYNTNIEGIIAALDALGIGYFQSYTELGQLYLSTYNDNTEFGLLTITNNGAPATSTTTTTTTAAPTTSTTTTTTTGAPVQFFLGYNVAGGDSACSTGAGIYYAAAGTVTLQNGTIIYTDTFVPLTVPAPVGYYSDGTNWWYVSGVVAGELTSETICFSGTSTTTTTTTAAPTTTTTSTTTAAPTTSTTSTTTAAPTTSTTTTSTTAAPTTTTTTTTTAAPTTTTTTSTTTAGNFSNTIGFGGAPEDACGFAASGSVTGDAPLFCDCTTFTGAIIAAAATGTWYISFGGNFVSVSIINGNPVATVTSSCTACSSITSTTTTTTTAAPTTTTTTTTTAAPTTTSTTSTTTAAVFTYALGVDPISGNGACLDFTIAPINYYSASSSLVNGVILYQDPALTTLVPDNYYSDGIQNWLVASGNGTLTTETLCSLTTTTTSTTTAAPTSTTTTSTTAAPTTTSTTTSTTTAAANIFIQNLSLDVSITQVDFGGITATLVAGTLPNTTGNGTDLNTTQVGTFTLDVYRSNTVAGQHITVTDSNLAVQCIFFSNGTAIESFSGVVYDGVTPINIEALDGAC
jgi:hypothetical protein